MVIYLAALPAKVSPNLLLIAGVEFTTVVDSSKCFQKPELDIAFQFKHMLLMQTYSAPVAGEPVSRGGHLCGR